MFAKLPDVQKVAVWTLQLGRDQSDQPRRNPVDEKNAWITACELVFRRPRRYIWIDIVNGDGIRVQLGSQLP